MKKFKKNTYLLILIFLHTNYAQPQYSYWTQDPPIKFYDPIGYFVDSIYLCFENNSYDLNAILSPFGDSPIMGGYTNIYGPELRISIYDLNELIQNGELEIKRIPDSLPINKTRFNIKIQDLEFKIEKNELFQNNWNSVISAKNIIDTLVIENSKLEEQKFYRKGKLIIDTTGVLNGDSISVFFRRKKDPAFLKLKFIKKDPMLSPPLIMGNFHNYKKETTIERFIQDAYKHYLTIDQSFYKNKPGVNTNQNDKVFETSKLALFFRPVKGIRNDSAFEYRLLVNGKAPKWKKSDNIIYVYNLKAANQYQLEVRYTDKPQYVYRYKFYVPANLYQSGWFKVATIGFLLLLGSILFLYSGNKKQKKYQLQQETKLKSLSAQLNPHFVFNALGSIQGLLNDGRIERANHYLSGFGDLLRNTLDSSEKLMLTLGQEIKNLETYIKLEQLRTPFTYTIQIDKTLYVSNIEMLPLLIQPLVENAVKHAAARNHNELKISLAFIKEHQNLIVAIKDNGSGFDTTKNYKGKGISLTKERINLFNSMHKIEKINYEVDSDYLGTAVHLKFINWLSND